MYRLQRRGGTAELWDGASRLVATTRFSGEVAFATLDIECPQTGERLRSSPNRRVMPSAWRLAPGDGGSETVYSRRIGRALVNPWGRTMLSVDREPASGSYRVVDASRSGIDRALNLERSEWALVRGDQAVGRLGFVRRPDDDGQEAGGGGLFGRVRGVARALTYDRALLPLGQAGDLSTDAGSEPDTDDERAPGRQHDLTPAEALVLLLLVESFTSTA